MIYEYDYDIVLFVKWVFTGINKKKLIKHDDKRIRHKIVCLTFLPSAWQRGTECTKQNEVFALLERRQTPLVCLGQNGKHLQRKRNVEAFVARRFYGSCKVILWQDFGWHCRSIAHQHILIQMKPQLFSKSLQALALDASSCVKP